MNRFIKAMEIGLRHEVDGISYFTLIETVEKELKRKFEAYAEATFYSWFIENFDKPIRSSEPIEFTKYDFYNFLLERDSKEIDTLSPQSKKLKKRLKEVYFVKGEVAKQYLDYLELQESRESGKKASRLSIISIFVAVIAILFGLFKNDDYPKPPYDVNIVQDRLDKIKQLNRINELSDRLYEAELLLEFYKCSVETIKVEQLINSTDENNTATNKKK